MKPEISEFSFGFALTAELIATFNLKSAGAPEFATQYAEGQVGGGWDVKLSATPIYLQFKRSHRMVTRGAQEYHLFSSLPFYRMYIHRRNHSDQHQLLLDLENLGNLVLYAAPGFSRSSELQTVYSADRVAESSLFLRPSEVKALADDEQHWVAFQMVPERTYFCSQPRRVKAEPAKQLFTHDALRALSKGNQPELSNEFFLRISNEMLTVYEHHGRFALGTELMAKLRQTRGRRSPAEFAQFLAQTLFDCQLLVYVEWENAGQTIQVM
jgi:hypothetical protein